MRDLLQQEIESKQEPNALYEKLGIINKNGKFLLILQKVARNGKNLNPFFYLCSS
ncbi:MAG: hypothetical protein IK003_06100 [Prevotella sp.]|nr:hypothetical protein [Prevotella sp.]